VKETAKPGDARGASETHPIDAGGPAVRAIRRQSGAVLFPNHYAWYLIVATMDVMLTHKILGEFWHLGGREVNPIAQYFIEKLGYWATVALKYSTVVVVIAVCESVGRKYPHTGRGLAIAAVVLSALPVAWGLVQLARFAFSG